MATGIVSIALLYSGLPTLSSILMGVAGASYLLLLVATLWRVLAFREDVREDLANPGLAFGFFTFVAGTNVLGTRIALDGHVWIAAVLLGLGVATWLVLGYLVPWTATLSRHPKQESTGANGTWFVWTVASQSIAVLAAVLEPMVDVGQRELALLAVASWSVGVVLYGVVGVSVVAQLLHDEIRSGDLTPPYWVAMGATAITALAGARVAEMSDGAMVGDVTGMIAGASMVFWAFGTWLIPALIAIGWWRHIAHRVPLRYDATLWSIVFPLGMYGVAGLTLGRVVHLPLLEAIGRHEVWLALAAWSATFVAMVVHEVRIHVSSLTRRTSEGPASVAVEDSRRRDSELAVPAHDVGDADSQP